MADSGIKDDRFFSHQVKQFLKEFIQIVLFVMVIQVGLARAYHVPTGSMEKTVKTGDFFIADKLTLGPRTPDWIGIPFTYLGFNIPAVKLPGFRQVTPGDIVVVRTPMNKKVPYVKRVVATGGQIIEIRNKVVYVDGLPRKEPAGVQHSDPRILPPGIRMRSIYQGLGNRDQFGPFHVPEGTVFLMGDNRDNSFDSRFFGPVPEDNIIAKARMVTFSFHAGRNTPPWQWLDLSRTGRILK